MHEYLRNFYEKFVSTQRRVYFYTFFGVKHLLSIKVNCEYNDTVSLLLCNAMTHVIPLMDKKCYAHSAIK